MNNSIKARNSNEVTIQLKRAEVQRKILIKNIYKEYERYFKIVRKSIQSSVEKGIFGIFSEFYISDKVLNLSELNNFLNKNIRTLIKSKLPLITIEQLKLGEENDISNHLLNMNSLKDFLETKEYQTVNFDYGNESITGESLEFCCNNTINTYEYYESLDEDKISSVNLDENSYLNFFHNKISFKETEYDKNIVDSLFELIEETNDIKLNDDEKINDPINDVFISCDNLNSFEIIDKSFNNLLLNISYIVNSELFQIKLIKKIISEDKFNYLSNNNNMISHPHPFVISFDLNQNGSSGNNDKLCEFCLFNINNVELEFYNLDLSICRNNINDLKNSFRLLNKKQRYWENKNLSSNKINK